VGILKKQGFVTGAVILMAANAISKILGAVFKIPLTYILKEEGMAIFNTSFQVYIMILSFIISGFPFAISKSVAESISKKEYAKAHMTVKIATLILSVIGIIGSVVLYFGAPFFAVAMKEENAAYAMRAISPAVFFVALGTAYKSYFQGSSNMIPTAVSQVIEAIIKLAAGYGLAVYFIKGGAAKTSGGAVMGVTAGEIVATIMLMAMYFKYKEKIKIKSEQIDKKEIIQSLLSVAIPLLCASVIMDMLNVVDTTMLRSRLLYSGLNADEARFLYGAYTGYALTVFHLPIGILSTLGVSILPIIAGAIAVGNTERAQKATYLALRLTIMLTIPCTILFAMQSENILQLLFKNSTSAKMLSLVSPCVIMMCVSQICASVLQSANKIMLPFCFSLVGIAIKLVVGYVLIGNPNYNIYGSAMSACISNFVVMILNLAAIKRTLRLKFNFMSIIIKPAAAATVMCAVVYFLQSPICAWTQSSFLRLAVICSASCTAYLLMLLLTNALSIKEVRKMLK
jgi:stage V sporulation protein B